MPRIEERIEIAAPTSTVFRACHDADKRPKWDERIKRMELITPAPIRQGTLFQVDATSSGGTVFGWEGEFSEYRYPMNATLKVLDAAPSSPFNSGSETWQFSTMGDGTRFTLVWEYTPRHFVASILDLLMRRAATRRAVRRSLANLKAMIEGG